MNMYNTKRIIISQKYMFTTYCLNWSQNTYRQSKYVYTKECGIQHRESLWFGFVFLFELALKLNRKSQEAKLKWKKKYIWCVKTSCETHDWNKCQMQMHIKPISLLPRHIPSDDKQLHYLFLYCVAIEASSNLNAKHWQRNTCYVSIFGVCVWCVDLFSHDLCFNF